MADTTEARHTIDMDTEAPSCGGTTARIYRDEPILMTARQLETFTPPAIRKMRRLAGDNRFGAQAFYEQGRFMEAFEDDFDYRGEFAQYFSTYQHMTDAQLRGYFSWRTRVRKGGVEKTSLSYAFVYIYELLNQIGVHSPLEGFHALRNFWIAYREHDPRINSYAEMWLKDYVVYNDLDSALLDGLSDIAFNGAVEVLLDHRTHGVEDVFSALDAISSYKLQDSRFFKSHPEEMKEVVHRVFSLVSDYHNKKTPDGAKDKLFGRFCASHYTMFKSAVFYHRAAQRDRVYEIGPYHRYMFRNGQWSCARFLCYGNNNKRVGALLKTVDFVMRKIYGFNSTLQPGKTNKLLTGKIEKEIAAYLEEKRKNTPPRIDIDVSKLQRIRNAASATRDKLLVETEADEEPPPATAADSGQKDATGLTDTEYRFMRCLLHGLAYDSLLRSNGLMVSVLVDAINGKLFERFGDTVIGDNGGKPELIEDYVEELKGIIE